VHDIGVTWFACTETGCKYTGKGQSSVRSHLSYAHDIGVQWFPCSEASCIYTSKQKHNMVRHLSNVHDIGDHKCMYCLRNRNTSIRYDDPALHTKVMICRACFNRKTGKNTRIEKTWSDYVDGELGRTSCCRRTSLCARRAAVLAGVRTSFTHRVGWSSSTSVTKTSTDTRTATIHATRSVLPKSTTSPRL
jgi:hypothetical protein